MICDSCDRERIVTYFAIANPHDAYRNKHEPEAMYLCDECAEYISCPDSGEVEPGDTVTVDWDALIDYQASLPDQEEARP